MKDAVIIISEGDGITICTIVSPVCGPIQEGSRHGIPLVVEDAVIIKSHCYGIAVGPIVGDEA